MMDKIKAGAAIIIIALVFVVWLRLGTFRFELLLAGLAALALGLWGAKWAFWPRRELPRNRIRHQRIRLYLRLHPGPGQATVWELHRHWSRIAAYKRASRVRSS